MVKQNKIFEVDNVTAKIKEAKVVALADYRGLTVSQISQLREKVKEAGGELQVIKNTLLLRALRNNRYKLASGDIEGPTIVLFANKDEISLLKVMAEFAKLVNLLPFKIGFMDGLNLSVENLNKYASIPPLNQLQARLVSMLASPPGRLVYALNYNIQKLALVLGQIRNQKPKTN